MAVKITAELEPSDIFMEGDGNNDGRIDIAEAISALRKLSGLPAE